MILSLKSKLRYYILALIATVSFTQAYDLKLYTNENYNKNITTKYFKIYYNSKNWQLANWFATKVDTWADDVHTARGWKPSIKVDLYLVHDSMIKNAFSSYDRLYLLTNTIVNFTEPYQVAWMEDVFKHEYGHSTVSLGSYNPFLLYSGIDGFLKFRKNTILTGTLHEGSSVLLESTYGLTPGRLASPKFVNTILYNADRGYKVDFWKSDDRSVGYKYNEGAMFFKFIYDTYGEDKWRNAFNSYINSYWNLLSYRYPQFLAKELGESYSDLMNLYSNWLAKQSLQATPKNAVQGLPLAGQTSTVGSLVDIIDGKLYFTASGGAGKIKIASVPVSVAENALYKQKTEFTYVAGKGVASNDVLEIDENKFKVYHRVSVNRSVLGAGLDSYYIQSDVNNNALVENFGNTILDETKNTEFMVLADGRQFVVSKQFSSYQLHDPINNEVILAYNQNFVIDRPRYSKEQNAIYFAANKVGDPKAYIFMYNLQTKQLKALVQGIKPFISNNNLFFVNAVGEDKALNAFKLNLNTNQVVKLTNLKYGLREAVATEDKLFYTSFNATGSGESYITTTHTIYSLNENEWLNEPHNELVAEANNFDFNASTSTVPIVQTEDKGKNVYVVNPALQPVNFFYTLDGNFLVNLRNQQDNVRLQVGLVTDSKYRTVIEDPANWQDKDGNFTKPIKDVFKNQYDLDKKNIMARLVYSPGLGASGLTRSSKYNFFDARIEYNKKPKYKKQVYTGAISTGLPQSLLPANSKSDIGWFGGQAVATVTDDVTFNLQFAPRIWSVSYGIVPLIDVISTVAFQSSKHNVDVAIKGPVTLPRKSDYLIGSNFNLSTSSVFDRYKLGVRFDWQEFNTVLEGSVVAQNRWDIIGKVINTGVYTKQYDTYYIRLTKSSVYKNTTNYNLKLEVNDVLKSDIFAKVLPIDNSNFDLEVRYVHGETPYSVNPTLQVQDKYDLDMSSYLNPFGATGAFDINTGYSTAAQNGTLYVIPPVSTNRQTDVLQLNLSKLYSFNLYIGNQNFGMRKVNLAPFASYINVWGNYRNSSGENIIRFSSSNIYYGIAMSGVFSVWRLEPEVTLSFFSKEAVKKASNHFSGKKNLVGGFLDAEYKGLLLNATIRF